MAVSARLADCDMRSEDGFCGIATSGDSSVKKGVPTSYASRPSVEPENNVPHAGYAQRIGISTKSFALVCGGPLRPDGRSCGLRKMKSQSALWYSYLGTTDHRKPDVITMVGRQ